MTLIETKPLLRSARLLGHVLLVLFGLAVIAAVAVIVWLVSDLQAAGQMLAVNVGYGGAELLGWQTASLGLVWLVHIGIWAAVTWQGRQIFTGLTGDDIEAATVAARQTARLLWIMLIWGIAAHTLGALIATWNFPEGQRALSVALGTEQISTAIAALLATFSTQAFVLGAALWRDHQEVI